MFGLQRRVFGPGSRDGVAINLETAVVIAAKQRRSSVGATFRAILATAEQFQTGERPPLNLFNRYSDLVPLAAVNCGFSDQSAQSQFLVAVVFLVVAVLWLLLNRARRRPPRAGKARAIRTAAVWRGRRVPSAAIAVAPACHGPVTAASHTRSCGPRSPADSPKEPPT